MTHHRLLTVLLAIASHCAMAQDSANAVDASSIGGFRLESDGAYHIRTHVDLRGQRVALRGGARLVFEGGTLDNGILVADGNTVVAADTVRLFGERLHLSGRWVVSARPEWFGARGDGIAYYDRPLRCFARKVGGVKVSPHASRAVVSHPSARIANQDFWKIAPTHTTDQVVLDTVRHQFLLYDRGVYHATWSNDHEWNRNGRVRSDAVYSDLSDRKTYVSIEGRMTDIDSTMTNDALAINRAMEMGRGNIRLRPVVYYVKTTREAHGTHVPWRGFDGFHLDGGGATLFVRSESVGDSHRFSQVTWGWFYQCRNGRIDHLNICALRDRDDGAPKGHHRYDSSDSRMVAFGINGCESFVLSNLRLKGMSHDFIIKRGYGGSGDSRDIRIEDWQSEGFTQNVFAGVRGCHITRAHLTQAPLVGTGLHIIYGQPYLKGLYVSHSTFRQADGYTTVMLTHHGGTKRPESCPDSIYYDHCVIEGSRMVQGGGWQHQTFTHCTFRQTEPMLLTGDTIVANGYAVIGTRIHLTFDHCRFSLSSAGLINSGWSDGAPLQLLMHDCQVDAAAVKRPLIIRHGETRLSDCKFKCGGEVFSKNSSRPAVTRCTKNGQPVPTR